MTPTNNKRYQLYFNLAASLISLVFGLGVNFFLSPYIVRTLGVEANGFVALAGNFIMFASLITIALNSMAGRFIAIAYHQNDFDKANKYYTTTIIGNLVIIGTLILPSIFFVYHLESFINIEKDIVNVRFLFALSFLNFFISQLFSIFSVATFITNKLHIISTITVCRTIVNALLITLLFTLFVPKIYYTVLVATFLALLNGVAIWQIKNVLSSNLKFEKSNFRFSHLKTILASGIWNTINQAGHLLMTGSDLIIANIFINPVQMGILAIAKTAPTQIIALGHTVNYNFSPNLTELYAKNDTAALLIELKSAMKISSIFMSIPVMVFCVFGQSFYQLWMPSLDAHVLLILSILTCLTFIPASGTHVLYNVFTVKNKLTFNSITFLINGVINVILMYLLLKYSNLGIYAIAGVSSTTTIIRLICFTLPYTAKLLELPWYIFYWDILISLLCAAVCLVTSLFFSWLLDPSTWLELTGAVMIACLLSLLIQLVILSSKTERARIFQKITSRNRSKSL